MERVMCFSCGKETNSCDRTLMLPRSPNIRIACADCFKRSERIDNVCIVNVDVSASGKIVAIYYR